MTQASAPRKPPGSVALAIGALLLVVVAQAALALSFGRGGQAGWAMYAAFLLLFGLLVVGLARRSRLAWLWGRYLSMVLGVVVAVSLLVRWRAGGVSAPGLAIALGALALPLVVASVALGRRSAYPYFDLVCPTCAARTGIGEDLLFRRARCPTCGQVW